jgi:hypothetical protein
MYRRAAFAAALLAGCFGPTLPGNVMCAEGLCPDGFVCDDGFCRATLSVDPDAAPADAGVDAPVCATLTFRDNLDDPDGYDATDDTTLDEDEPNVALGDELIVFWDGETTAVNLEFGLLRFNEVFGDGAAEVPAGAEIIAATLRVQIVNESSDEPGEIFETAVDWDESTTIATFGASPGVDPGDLGDRVADAPIDPGPASIDVTDSAVRGSAAGVMPGWIITPAEGNPDGAEIASSETEDEDSRPTLEISYCD